MLIGGARIPPSRCGLSTGNVFLNAALAEGFLSMDVRDTAARLSHAV